MIWAKKKIIKWVDIQAAYLDLEIWGFRVFIIVAKG